MDKPCVKSVREEPDGARQLGEAKAVEWQAGAAPSHRVAVEGAGRLADTPPDGVRHSRLLLCLPPRRARHRVTQADLCTCGACDWVKSVIDCDRVISAGCHQCAGESVTTVSSWCDPTRQP